MLVVCKLFGERRDRKRETNKNWTHWMPIQVLDCFTEPAPAIYLRDSALRAHAPHTIGIDAKFCCRSKCAWRHGSANKRPSFCCDSPPALCHLSLQTKIYAQNACLEQRHYRLARFPSNPLMIRVPFFLLLSFNKETPKMKREKGHYWST